MRAGKHPVVLVMADQLRRDLVGAYAPSHALARTPNLDRLATEGVVFDRAYTVYAVCTPARASLHTGWYPCRHGMQNNLFQPGCVVHELPDTPGLLSRRLGDAGYACGFTGKWHLGYGQDAHADPWYRQHVVEGAVDLVEYPEWYRQGTSLPTAQGWEGYDFPGHGDGGHHYESFHRHVREKGLAFELKQRPGGAEVLSGRESTVDHWLVDHAIGLTDRFRKRRDPFHISLNFWGPHLPCHVPPEFLDPFRELDIPPHPTFDEPLHGKPGIHQAKQPGAPWSFHAEKLRMTAAYMHYIDWEVGRYFDHLRETGVYDDAWIIFCADHGDTLGIHGGLVDKGFQMYEESVGIPLIVKPPNGVGRAGGREQRLVNTTDLYATILDIAGSPHAEARHGRSLVPLVQGREVPWREAVVSEFTGLAFMACSQRMARKGMLKYTFNCAGPDELYDLDADPGEQVNRIDDPAYADRLLGMRRTLAEELERLGDPMTAQYRLMRCRDALEPGLNG